MIPLVTLLNIDHWAKNAIPITAKMDDIKSPKSLMFIPHIKNKQIINKKVDR